MEKIIDFLNTKQKISLLEYELLEKDNFSTLENGDKINCSKIIRIFYFQHWL